MRARHAGWLESRMTISKGREGRRAILPWRLEIRKRRAKRGVNWKRLAPIPLTRLGIVEACSIETPSPPKWGEDGFERMREAG
jgi:hypothetical protein